jgi:hypothetical protein
MVYPVGSIIHFYGNPASLLTQGSRAFFYPHTWYYHTAILGEYIPEERDYEILESINQGVRLGRLSFYKDRIFRLYWPTGVNQGIGRDIKIRASKFGRVNYDWLFYFDIAIAFIKVQINNLKVYHRFFSARPDELHVNRHVNFVCTRFSEEFWSLYNADVPFPQTWAPLPAAYEKAVEEGKLELIGENVVDYVGLRTRIADKIFGRSRQNNQWPRSLMSVPTPQR